MCGSDEPNGRPFWGLRGCQVSKGESEMGRFLMLWAFALFVAASMLAGIVSNANADCCIYANCQTYNLGPGGHIILDNFTFSCEDVVACAITVGCTKKKDCFDPHGSVPASGRVDGPANSDVTVCRNSFLPFGHPNCTYGRIPTNTYSMIPKYEISGTGVEISSLEITNDQMLLDCLLCYICPYNMFEILKEQIQNCLEEMVNDDIAGQGTWRSKGHLGVCGY